jgi:FkbM family methyltransferase
MQQNLYSNARIGLKSPRQLQHKTPARVILINGILFESHAIYWADMYAIFFQGIYTPPFLPIEKNDTVVDIGANIGVFTIYAATRTRKQNKVYAFEPFPINFEALQQNIRANRLNNVIPCKLAVSVQSGTELFTDSTDDWRLKIVALIATEKYIEVPSIILEDLMDQNHLEQIDLLKMDCEGSEGIILRSTSRSYLQRIRNISMEFHDRISKLKHDQMRALLEDADFTTNVIWDGKSKLGFLYACMLGGVDKRVSLLYLILPFATLGALRSSHPTIRQIYHSVVRCPKRSCEYGLLLGSRRG